jgi:hypothetical protein
MKYDLIRNGKVISHFDDTAISTKQLIQLHRAGYKFEPREAAYSLMRTMPELAGLSELPMLLQHQAF